MGMVEVTCWLFLLWVSVKRTVLRHVDLISDTNTIICVAIYCNKKSLPILWTQIRVHHTPHEIMTLRLWQNVILAVLLEGVMAALFFLSLNTIRSFSDLSGHTKLVLHLKISWKFASPDPQSEFDGSWTPWLHSPNPAALGGFSSKKLKIS